MCPAYLFYQVVKLPFIVQGTSGPSYHVVSVRHQAYRQLPVQARLFMTWSTCSPALC